MISKFYLLSNTKLSVEIAQKRRLLLSWKKVLLLLTSDHQAREQKRWVQMSISSVRCGKRMEFSHPIRHTHTPSGGRYDNAIARKRGT
jgi:hypothetical protein